MIYETGFISLIIHFLTGAINIWGLNIKVPDDKKKEHISDSVQMR
jgi:hypothetical protein